MFVQKMNDLFPFRVFDQYEINLEIKKHRHSYLSTGNETPPEVDHMEFGLWDAIFNLGIVPTLVGTKKWKPEKEELEKELKKLGLAKDDVKLSKLEEEILLDPSNPIENVKEHELK